MGPKKLRGIKMSISFEFAQKQSTKRLQQKAYLEMVNAEEQSVELFTDVTENHIQKILRENHKNFCVSFSARKASKAARNAFDIEHTDLD